MSCFLTIEPSMFSAGPGSKESGVAVLISVDGFLEFFITALAALVLFNEFCVGAIVHNSP